MKLKLRWLVVLSLVVALATTVTLSRYTSKITGKGTAAVAAVDMSAQNLQFTAKDLRPGGTTSFSFQVINFSEGSVSDVTQSYTISVTSTGNLPLTFSLSSPDGSFDHALTKSDSGNIWSGGILEHTTENTHTYTLTATWDPEDNAPALADEIDLITVTVDSEQVVTA